MKEKKHCERVYTDKHGNKGATCANFLPCYSDHLLGESKEELDPRIIINALIERFDDLEEEIGTDFTNAKRIILHWAKKHNIFSL